MASLNISIISLILLFLTCLPIPITNLSQPVPTIVDCGPRVLPLAPCLPFVQGTVSSPTHPCCNSLKQLYNQQPSCLCLLLNGTALSSVPINTTLAMELPLLCTLQVNNISTTCSVSSPEGVSVPASSPASQVSFGTSTNATVAASPTVTVAPRSSIIGFGFHRSTSIKLETQGQWGTATAMAFLFTKLLVYF